MNWRQDCRKIKGRWDSGKARFENGKKKMGREKRGASL